MKNYNETFLNQLEIVNNYYSRCRYSKDLDKVFSSRKFTSKIKEIYDTMSKGCSWDEFRIGVILQTKVSIYSAIEKVSRMSAGRIDIVRCESEIITRAENVARGLAV